MPTIDSNAEKIAITEKNVAELTLQVARLEERVNNAEDKISVLDDKVISGNPSLIQQISELNARMGGNTKLLWYIASIMSMIAVETLLQIIRHSM